MIDRIEEIIRVDNLKYRYPKSEKDTLKDISFSINKGKIYTMLGANGSGKSTIFNLITKNLFCSKDRIKVRGQDICDISLKELSKILSVVHQNNLYPDDVRVHELVSYGRNPHLGLFSTLKEEDEEKIYWAMKVTDTLDIKDRKLSELSGGQRQRVFIAMALCQDTEIILLDEPTTFLDIRYQIEILDLIKRLNTELSITVLMILHDINQAIKYSDELILLKEGMIIALGRPKEVISERSLKKIYNTSLRLFENEGESFVLTC